MNFTIDIGNTYAKLGWFEKGILFRTFLLPSAMVKTILTITSYPKLPISSIILSTVIHHPKSFEKHLRKNFFFISLSHKTPLPIKNKYKTPETLGNDRLAAVVGANYLFPKHNLLVIDAGTCITYDFINKKREYLGGSISPGITMRFRALHTFTHRLPLIEQQKTKSFIGNSTNNAILTGVQNGVLAEMDGMIDNYKNKFPGTKIIITGGDADFFERQLKNEIFALPNLVLYGLNTILEYNS